MRHSHGKEDGLEERRLAAHIRTGQDDERAFCAAQIDRVWDKGGRAEERMAAVFQGKTDVFFRVHLGNALWIWQPVVVLLDAVNAVRNGT